MTQQFSISPKGAATSTHRGSDDPDFQRCDGCDRGLIVEDPAKPWHCPFCRHRQRRLGPRLARNVRRGWRGQRALLDRVGGRPSNALNAVGDHQAQTGKRGDQKCTNWHRPDADCPKCGCENAFSGFLQYREIAACAGRRFGVMAWKSEVCDYKNAYRTAGLYVHRMLKLTANGDLGHCCSQCVPILLVAAIIGAVVLRELWLRDGEAHRFAIAHTGDDGMVVLSRAHQLRRYEQYRLQVRWNGRLRQLPFEPYRRRGPPSHDESPYPSPAVG